jgi:hypothetical protein
MSKVVALLLASSTALACLSDSAHAGQATGIGTEGWWAIYRDTMADGNRICTAAAFYKDYNIALRLHSVAVDGERRYAISLANEKWKLTEGNAYDLTLTAPHNKKWNLSFQVISERQMSANVSRDVMNSIAMDNNGFTMTLRAANKKHGPFLLDSSAAAIRAIVNCVSDGLKTAKKPEEPKPSAPTSKARTDSLTTHGAWTAMTGTSTEGTPMCALSISNPKTDKWFYLKWFNNDNPSELEMQLVSPDWKIPADTDVPLKIWFDQDEDDGYTGNGFGSETIQQLLVARFPSEIVGDLMKKLRAAKNFAIAFPSGNEKPWNLKMDGIQAAVDAFARCIKKTAGTATFPFADEVTQPFTAQPTQPFNPGSKAPLPSRPGERGA